MNNIFLNYYIDKKQERQEELDFCFYANFWKLENTHFYILVNREQEKIFYQKKFEGKHYPQSISIIEKEERPTFNDYFDLTRVYSKDADINIIPNSDIIIPKETLKLIPKYFEENNKRCLALTRWDIIKLENYENNSVLFNRVDSQDIWVFKGKVPYISGADFTLGMRGCDNAIAHILEQNGYEVINPSITLKTYHFHKTGIRNYNQDSEAVPPPYKLLTPTI